MQNVLKRRLFIGSGLLLAALGGIGFLKLGPKPLSDDALNAVYAQTLSKPEAPMRVFHLGHSLVNRDMPVMLDQLAGPGHAHDSQLGWGTPLRAHWEDNEPIQGFETENNHPRYRDAKQALASGDYEAVVLTEMVEIEAAIDYFDSPEYLAKWAGAARSGREDVRVFLYESWHDLNDPQGWLNRLDIDLDRYWEGVLLKQALAYDPDRHPIYVIPAGQALAAFVRKIESADFGAAFPDRTALFQRSESGELDTIHLNDWGNYMVALTHYAVLYQQSPVGLGYELTNASDALMPPLPPAIAQLMQETVWDVVKTYGKTGIP